LKEKNRMSREETAPCVAVIVPSLNGKGEGLRELLANQTLLPSEVQIVTGVRPNGKARNQGVARTTGEILVFIDDDAQPGSQQLLENLVQDLLSDETIGVTGAARVLPSDASWFQRRVAAEIPRTVNPVPLTSLETNPPLQGYGHSLITTTCCAMRRTVFEQAGGFCETLTSGVDTDMFYRIRRLGYRFVMLPHVFVEHPAPDSLRALWRKFFWYGRGYGQETQRRPYRRLGFRLSSRFRRVGFLVGATLWFLPNIFILYSLGYPRLQFGFRPLKALSTYAVAWGYVNAWQQGAMLEP
jgi:GT2 family glycosyltransferase